MQNKTMYEQCRIKQRHNMLYKSALSKLVSGLFQFQQIIICPTDNDISMILKHGKRVILAQKSFTNYIFTQVPNHLSKTQSRCVLLLFGYLIEYQLANRPGWHTQQQLMTKLPGKLTGMAHTATTHDNIARKIV